MSPQLRQAAFTWDLDLSSSHPCSPGLISCPPQPTCIKRQLYVPVCIPPPCPSLGASWSSRCPVFCMTLPRRVSPGRGSSPHHPWQGQEEKWRLRSGGQCASKAWETPPFSMPVVGCSAATVPGKWLAAPLKPPAPHLPASCPPCRGCPQRRRGREAEGEPRRGPAFGGMVGCLRRGRAVVPPMQHWKAGFRSGGCELRPWPFGSSSPLP